MTVGDGFRQLAALVDALDTTDIDIRDVSVAEADDGTVVADVQVAVPAEGTVDPSAVAVRGETRSDATGGDPAGRDGDERDGETGTASATDSGSTPGEVTDEDGAAGGDGEQAAAPDDPDVTAAGADDVTADSADAATEDRDSEAESVVCRAPDCDETFETEHGMKIHHTKVHGPSLVDETPAYKDPERLREAYENHSSFAEMREALGADVSAQTVRRNMMKHGIHDPAGRDETADGDGGTDDGASERPAPDGADADGDPVEGTGTAVDGGRSVGDDGAENVGGPAADQPAPDPSVVDPPAVDLPDGVSLDDVTAAVESANTLYEVQQTLGVDRDRAMSLLDDLDLLELVHGRVATKRRRDDLKEEIGRRLRRRAHSGR